MGHSNLIKAPLYSLNLFPLLINQHLAIVLRIKISFMKLFSHLCKKIKQVCGVEFQKDNFNQQIIKCHMSQEQIHQDSLLSSISNISVKIDHTQIDDPGFFIQNMQKSMDDHRIDCEVDIEVLEDDEDIDPASLVKQIYYRYRGERIGMEQDEGIERWMGKREEEGVSEEEEAGGKSYEQIEKVWEKQQFIKEQLPSSNIPHASIPKRLLPIQQKKLPSTQQNPYFLYQQIPQPSQQKRLKNQTKNIPKNYGKAIITFIQKYQPQVRSILSHHNINYQEFTSQLKQRKRVINTIADLRSMWLDYDYPKSMRVLSNLFLRKYALSYIFNSRICNYASHIKYRYRLMEAIKQPGLFKHIKDY